jgi:hypothetical protein
MLAPFFELRDELEHTRDELFKLRMLCAQAQEQRAEI